MRVHGQWLDLVNLRSEEYTEASRIPEMKFGSATDDAYRRDLTINSLFYNINLRCVEDFTGMGLKDLQDGVVAAAAAAADDVPGRPAAHPRSTIRQQIRIFPRRRHRARGDGRGGSGAPLRVSRERVGKEVQGMLRGPSPGDALSLLAGLTSSTRCSPRRSPRCFHDRLPPTVAWVPPSMRCLEPFVLSSLAPL